MYKSALIAALLSGVLFATHATTVVAAPESSAESNIGFVIYTKSLDARDLERAMDVLDQVQGTRHCNGRAEEQALPGDTTFVTSMTAASSRTNMTC